MDEKRHVTNPSILSSGIFYPGCQVAARHWQVVQTFELHTSSRDLDWQTGLT